MNRKNFAVALLAALSTSSISASWSLEGKGILLVPIGDPKKDVSLPKALLPTQGAYSAVSVQQSGLPFLVGLQFSYGVSDKLKFHVGSYFCVTPVEYKFECKPQARGSFEKVPSEKFALLGSIAGSKFAPTSSVQGANQEILDHVRGLQKGASEQPVSLATRALSSPKLQKEANEYRTHYSTALRNLEAVEIGCKAIGSSSDRAKSANNLTLEQIAEEKGLVEEQLKAARASFELAAAKALDSEQKLNEAKARGGARKALKELEANFALDQSRLKDAAEKVKHVSVNCVDLKREVDTLSSQPSNSAGIAYLNSLKNKAEEVDQTSFNAEDVRKKLFSDELKGLQSAPKNQKGKASSQGSQSAGSSEFTGRWKQVDQPQSTQGSAGLPGGEDNEPPKRPGDKPATCPDQKGGKGNGKGKGNNKAQDEGKGNFFAKAGAKASAAFSKSFGAISRSKSQDASSLAAQTGIPSTPGRRISIPAANVAPATPLSGKPREEALVSIQSSLNAVCADLLQRSHDDPLSPDERIALARVQGMALAVADASPGKRPKVPSIKPFEEDLKRINAKLVDASGEQAQELHTEQSAIKGKIASYNKAFTAVLQQSLSAEQVSLILGEATSEIERASKKKREEAKRPLEGSETAAKLKQGASVEPLELQGAEATSSAVAQHAAELKPHERELLLSLLKEAESGREGGGFADGVASAQNRPAQAADERLMGIIEALKEAVDPKYETEVTEIRAQGEYQVGLEYLPGSFKDGSEYKAKVLSLNDTIAVSAMSGYSDMKRAGSSDKMAEITRKAIAKRRQEAEKALLAAEVSMPAKEAALRPSEACLTKPLPEGHSASSSPRSEAIGESAIPEVIQAPVAGSDGKQGVPAKGGSGEQSSEAPGIVGGSFVHLSSGATGGNGDQNPEDEKIIEGQKCSEDATKLANPGADEKLSPVADITSDAKAHSAPTSRSPSPVDPSLAGLPPVQKAEGSPAKVPTPASSRSSSAGGDSGRAPGRIPSPDLIDFDAPVTGKVEEALNSKALSRDGSVSRSPSASSASGSPVQASPVEAPSAPAIAGVSSPPASPAVPAVAEMSSPPASPAARSPALSRSSSASSASGSPVQSGSSAPLSHESSYPVPPSPNGCLEARFRTGEGLAPYSVHTQSEPWSFSLPSTPSPHKQTALGAQPLATESGPRVALGDHEEPVSLSANPSSVPSPNRFLDQAPPEQQRKFNSWLEQLSPGEQSALKEASPEQLQKFFMLEAGREEQVELVRRRNIEVTEVHELIAIEMEARHNRTLVKGSEANLGSLPKSTAPEGGAYTPLQLSTPDSALPDSSGELARRVLFNTPQGARPSASAESPAILPSAPLAISEPNASVEPVAVTPAIAEVSSAPTTNNVDEENWALFSPLPLHSTPPLATQVAPSNDPFALSREGSVSSLLSDAENLKASAEFELQNLPLNEGQERNSILAESDSERKMIEALEANAKFELQNLQLNEGQKRNLIESGEVSSVPVDPSAALSNLGGSLSTHIVPSGSSESNAAFSSSAGSVHEASGKEQQDLEAQALQAVKAVQLGHLSYEESMKRYFVHSDERFERGRVEKEKALVSGSPSAEQQVLEIGNPLDSGTLVRIKALKRNCAQEVHEGLSEEVKPLFDAEMSSIAVKEMQRAQLKVSELSERKLIEADQSDAWHSVLEAAEEIAFPAGAVSLQEQKRDARGSRDRDLAASSRSALGSHELIIRSTLNDEAKLLFDAAMLKLKEGSDVTTRPVPNFEGGVSSALPEADSSSHAKSAELTTVPLAANDASAHSAVSGERGLSSASRRVGGFILPDGSTASRPALESEEVPPHVPITRRNKGAYSSATAKGGRAGRTAAPFGALSSSYSIPERPSEASTVYLQPSGLSGSYSRRSAEASSDQHESWRKAQTSMQADSRHVSSGSWQPTGASVTQPLAAARSGWCSGNSSPYAQPYSLGNPASSASPYGSLGIFGRGLAQNTSAKLRDLQREEGKARESIGHEYDRGLRSMNLSESSERCDLQLPKAQLKRGAEAQARRSMEVERGLGSSQVPGIIQAPDPKSGGKPNVPAENKSGEQGAQASNAAEGSSVSLGSGVTGGNGDQNPEDEKIIEGQKCSEDALELKTPEKEGHDPQPEQERPCGTESQASPSVLSLTAEPGSPAQPLFPSLEPPLGFPALQASGGMEASAPDGYDSSSESDASSNSSSNDSGLDEAAVEGVFRNTEPLSAESSGLAMIPSSVPSLAAGAVSDYGALIQQGSNEVIFNDGLLSHYQDSLDRSVKKCLDSVCHARLVDPSFEGGRDSAYHYNDVWNKLDENYSGVQSAHPSARPTDPLRNFCLGVQLRADGHEGLYETVRDFLRQASAAAWDGSADQRSTYISYKGRLDDLLALASKKDLTEGQRLRLGTLKSLAGDLDELLQRRWLPDTEAVRSPSDAYWAANDLRRDLGEIKDALSCHDDVSTGSRLAGLLQPYSRQPHAGQIPLSFLPDNLRGLLSGMAGSGVQLPWPQEELLSSGEELEKDAMDKAYEEILRLHALGAEHIGFQELELRGLLESRGDNAMRNLTSAMRSEPTNYEALMQSASSSTASYEELIGRTVPPATSLEVDKLVASYRADIASCNSAFEEGRNNAATSVVWDALDVVDYRTVRTPIGSLRDFCFGVQFAQDDHTVIPAQLRYFLGHSREMLKQLLSPCSYDAGPYYRDARDELLNLIESPPGNLKLSKWGKSRLANLARIVGSIDERLATVGSTLPESEEFKLALDQYYTLAAILDEISDVANDYYGDSSAQDALRRRTLELLEQNRGAISQHPQLARVLSGMVYNLGDEIQEYLHAAVGPQEQRMADEAFANVERLHQVGFDLLSAHQQEVRGLIEQESHKSKFVISALQSARDFATERQKLQSISNGIRQDIEECREQATFVEGLNESLAGCSPSLSEVESAREENLKAHNFAQQAEVEFLECYGRNNIQIEALKEIEEIYASMATSAPALSSGVVSGGGAHAPGGTQATPGAGGAQVPGGTQAAPGAGGAHAPGGTQAAPGAGGAQVPGGTQAAPGAGGAQVPGGGAPGTGGVGGAQVPGGGAPGTGGVGGAGGVPGGGAPGTGGVPGGGAPGAAPAARRAGGGAGVVPTAAPQVAPVEKHEVVLSLKPHVPVMFGASYELYNNGKLSLNAGFNTGLTAWSACWKSVPASGGTAKDIKAEYSFAPAVLGSINLGVKVSPAAKITAGFGYAFFGEPKLTYKGSSEVGGSMPKASHGFSLSLGLSAGF